MHFGVKVQTLCPGQKKAWEKCIEKYTRVAKKVYEDYKIRQDKIKKGIKLPPKYPTEVNSTAYLDKILKKN